MFAERQPETISHPSAFYLYLPRGADLLLLPMLPQYNLTKQAVVELINISLRVGKLNKPESLRLRVISSFDIPGLKNLTLISHSLDLNNVSLLSIFIAVK